MWKYTNPSFECDKYNKAMLAYSPWSGHRRFGYDLMANMKPQVVVELGSFYGCSMFAFAQAVKDLNLITTLWAVDLWEIFDDFTKDDYKEDVYTSFCKVKDTCFSDEYLKMMKMSFDDAREHFEDKSIDILHIDGSHFYEDVKHDFETWRPKLKDNAIVLFHDIGDEIINGGIMGSHVFWEELKKEYPMNIQFDFSCGLGVVFLGQEIYQEFLKNVNIGYYQKVNNSNDVQIKDDIRKMYFQIRDANFYINDLKKQIIIKNENLDAYSYDMKKLQNDYETTIAGKDAYIKELENRVKEIEANSIATQKKIQSDYETTIIGKDAYIKELEEKVGR